MCNLFAYMGFARHVVRLVLSCLNMTGVVFFEFAFCLPFFNSKVLLIDTGARFYRPGTAAILHIGSVTY